jgi:hypothetical protein
MSSRESDSRERLSFMAWDSSRHVPWGRLFREWLVYAVVMIIVFALFLRDTVTGGSVLGLAASFPLYLAFGAVLAKFGYQRKTFRDLRSATESSRSAPRPAEHSTANGRHRPQPTKRTTTGPSQHRPKNSKRKR